MLQIQIILNIMLKLVKEFIILQSLKENVNNALREVSRVKQKDLNKIILQIMTLCDGLIDKSQGKSVCVVISRDILVRAVICCIALIH